MKCQCKKTKMIECYGQEYEVSAGSHSHNISNKYAVCSCGWYYNLIDERWFKENFGLVNAITNAIPYLKHKHDCDILNYLNLPCSCGANKIEILLVKLIDY